MNTIFGLLRHAQTQWNSQHRIQGRKDSPLTSHGEAESHLWGKTVHKYAQRDGAFSSILSSSLPRALRTAEIINKSIGVPIHTDDRLVEQDWGKWTGSTLQEIEREDGDELNRLVHLGWSFRPPGGEDRKEVLQRAVSCLHDHNGAQERILIVTHQGVIRCLLYAALNLDYMPGRTYPVQEYCYHTILLEQDTPKIVTMNESLTP